MIEKKGLSQRIRNVAQTRYVLPAINSGKTAFSLSVRDLMEDLRKEGISPEQNTPQFCTAIQKPAFLAENQLEIVDVEGPPSKLSTTVVVHYRVVPKSPPTHDAVVTPPMEESPAERAFRLTEKLRGLLKSELAEYGGADGFMRWIRSDEDEAA